MRSASKSARKASVTKREPAANLSKPTAKKPSDFPLLEMAAIVADWPDNTCGELNRLYSLLSEQVDVLASYGYAAVNVDSLRVGIDAILTRGELGDLAAELLRHMETVLQRKAELGA